MKKKPQKTISEIIRQAWVGSQTGSGLTLEQEQMMHDKAAIRREMNEAIRECIVGYELSEEIWWQNGNSTYADYQAAQATAKRALAELDALETKAAALDEYTEKVQRMGEG